MNNRKTAIAIVVILGLVIVALLAAFIFVPAPDSSGKPAPAEDWVTYRNDKYNFEIQHPADWIVAVDDEFEPKINIYKGSETAKPPFIHHHNVTQVSFFPKGIGTEGVEGDTAPSSVKFAEQTNQGIDFLLSDGTRWATYATFAAMPSSWESFGFVWASVHVSDPSSECVLDGNILPIEKCDLGDRPPGARIVLRGGINAEERALEERILSTFRFAEGS